jgi:hypothetical protein
MNRPKLAYHVKCRRLDVHGCLAAVFSPRCPPAFIKGIERVVPMLRFGVSMTGLGGRWHLIYAKF